VFSSGSQFAASTSWLFVTRNILRGSKNSFSGRFFTDLTGSTCTALSLVSDRSVMQLGDNKLSVLEMHFCSSR
jgi:hypothetical protein